MNKSITFSSLVNKHSDMLKAYLGDIAIDGMVIAGMKDGDIKYWGIQNSGCGTHLTDSEYHLKNLCSIIYKIEKAGDHLEVIATKVY